MQAQAGQGFELLARPARAHRHGSLRGRQHGVGIGLAAQPPQQRFELEPRAAAGFARRVASVLGQEHADVHLVGLALEVLEEAPDAVPLLVPVALPVRRALDHPIALRLGELAPRGVARNAGLAAVAQQVVLAFLPGRGLQGLDGARAQGLAMVGDHQPPVHADHAAEAAAGLAGAEGGVEGEHRGLRMAVAQVAVGAVQARGKAPHLGFALLLEHIHVDAPAATLEREFERLDHARLLGPLHAEAVGDDIEHLARPGRRGDLALGLHAREAGGREPLLDLLGRGAGRQLDGKGHHQPRARVAVRGAGAGQQLGVDRLRRVLAHRLRGLPVEQRRGACIEQLEVVVELGHRADRRARGPHRVGLVDRDGRRHAFHVVDRRAIHAVEELPRIGAEGLDIAALPLGIERIEHQARLSRARRAGDHRQLAGVEVDVEALEVVLAGAADADDTGGHEVEVLQ